MIVMKLVAMHDAVAATEVVYYASRELVANAMHCKQQTPGPKGMRSLHRYLFVLLLYCWKPTKETRVTRVGILGTIGFSVSGLGWLREAFPLLAPSNY